MKQFIVAVFVSVAVFSFAPAVTYAAGLTSSQVQAIISLLQSFGADSSVIADVQAALTGTTPVGTGTGTGSCVDLSNNLYAGISDTTTNGEVTKLQQFLGMNTTGYFGPMTLQAVQSWQSSHGVVSSGTPDTTGYGFVGPATRAAMGCTVSNENSNLSVNPSSGSAPLTVSINFTPGRADGISFGDGTTAEIGDVCTSTMCSENHRYANPGTYTIDLIENFGCDSHIADSCRQGVTFSSVVGTATIMVTGSNSTQPQAASLSVSTDASSPSYRIVAAGSSGIVIGAYRFHASNEPITLNKIGLKLTSGSTDDVVQAYVYDGATLVGNALFVGTSNTAISLLSPVTIPANGDKILTIKADLTQVGISQTGHAGDLVQIDFLNGQGTGTQSGLIVSPVGSTAVAGVRAFRSYPNIALIPLPSTGLSDGRLMRFSVTADAAGSVGIYKFGFDIAASQASLSLPSLYAFTDSAFSHPVAGGQNGYGVTYNSSALSNEVFSGGPVSAFLGASGHALEIPAGQTYYFEFRSSVAPAGNYPQVSTRLLGDQTYQGMIDANGVIVLNSNFFWSPNDKAVSQFSDQDWTNGYGIQGLPAAGVSQTRTGSGVSASAPTCNLVASPTSVQSGKSSALSWMTTNTASSSISSGVGSVSGATGTVYVTPSITTTYLFTAYGSNGQSAICSAPVTVVSPPTPSTSPTVTILLNGSHSASFAVGQPFSLSISSTNASSCTWTRTGSYSNWTNDPLPGGGTSFSQGPLTWTWSSGFGTYTATCANAAGVSVSDSASFVATQAY